MEDDRAHIKILEKRMQDLIVFLSSPSVLSPLDALAKEAKRYVETCMKCTEMLQNPDYWDSDGKIKLQYSYKLAIAKRDKDAQLKSQDFREFHWRYNTFKQAVKLLEEEGIIQEIHIGEYLTFLGLYLETIHSNFALYQAEDLNGPIKADAMFKFFDHKRKITNLLQEAKKEISEYGATCTFPLTKKRLSKRSLCSEFRKSLERLVNPAINEENENQETEKDELIPEQRRAIKLGLIISEDYYGTEILPTLNGN